MVQLLVKRLEAGFDVAKILHPAHHLVQLAAQVQAQAVAVAGVAAMGIERRGGFKALGFPDAVSVAIELAAGGGGFPHDHMI